MAESLFHPDLRTAARVLPRHLPQRPLLRLARLADRIAEKRLPPPGITRERVGAVRLRVHTPLHVSGPFPALLWIHGGGFIAGSSAQDDVFCRAVCQELGAIVAGVDYRLAPEHPFPVPLHDCRDALRWLVGRNDVDRRRVAVGGASAGGGLAAALTVLARDENIATPALQLLSYPMLDDRTTRRADIDERHLRIWDMRSNRFGWRAYLDCEPGAEGIDALAAPARVDDLVGLPPAWIGVGTLDLFLDEDRAFAERLQAAGVRCDLHIVDGVFHGFDAIRPSAGVSRAYRATQIEALRQAFRRPSSADPLTT